MISAGRFERNSTLVGKLNGMLGKVIYVTHGDPIKLEVIVW